jgi:hypothetical protein
LSQAGKAVGRFDICAVCGGIAPENANIYSPTVRRRPGRNCNPTGGLCCVPQPDGCYLASANPKMILITYEFDVHPGPSTAGVKCRWVEAVWRGGKPTGE